MRERSRIANKLLDVLVAGLLALAALYGCARLVIWWRGL
jgi:hypothetical protein